MKEIWPRNESWLIWTLFAWAVVCATAHGQYCVDQFGNRVPCQTQGTGWQSASYAAQQQTTPHPSRCRIYVQEGGGVQSVGSGMLVDNQTGLIITCGHLFRDSQQGITCTFPSGRRFEARFVAADHNSDLAAIRIRPTDIETLPINTAEQSGTLTAGGFGQDGQFAAATGQVVERVKSTGGATSAVISAPVRQGDSGGGVVNTSRQYVGVVWGCDDSGKAYVTTGRPLAQFLDRVFPARTGAIIPRATPRAAYGSPGGQYQAQQPRAYGSPGGQYAGEQPGYYGQPPLEPVQPIPPYTEPYPPPSNDYYPTLQEPEPDINWEAWEEQQQEIRNQQAQTQQQLQSLLVKIDGMQGIPGPQGPEGPMGPTGPTSDIDEIVRRLPPFWIRIVDPNNRSTTEFAEIRLGQEADLVFDLDYDPAQ